jgi:hypothetical protein
MQLMLPNEIRILSWKWDSVNCISLSVISCFIFTRYSKNQSQLTALRDHFDLHICRFISFEAFLLFISSQSNIIYVSVKSFSDF